MATLLMLIFIAVIVAFPDTPTKKPALFATPKQAAPKAPKYASSFSCAT
jgi:hypothetical protein